MPDPGLEPADWFVGDLDDPWVAAIADALPGDVGRRPCPGDLPPACFLESPPRGTLVLHRAVLTPHDCAVLAKYREGRTPPPRVVLCVGPHVRHADLERWAPLIDDVVPEATAVETIARRLADRPRPAGAGPRPRVGIVSRLFELRETLASVCEAAGYPVTTAADWFDAPSKGLMVWDVPALEPDWPRELARESSAGPVVALLGFPDRADVTRARAAGASACLELPCDPADLIYVLDRLALALARARAEPPHRVPPPPMAASRLLDAPEQLPGTARPGVSVPPVS